MAMQKVILPWNPGLNNPSGEVYWYEPVSSREWMLNCFKVVHSRNVYMHHNLAKILYLKMFYFPRQSVFACVAV